MSKLMRRTYCGANFNRGIEMIKRCCDICEREIKGQPMRLLTMGDENGHIMTCNGKNMDKENSFATIEVCLDCASAVVKFLDFLKAKKMGALSKPKKQNT